MAGPYLQAALFCERVIEGKDDFLSLIRVLDEVSIQLKGPSVPEQMPSILIPLTAVIILKSVDFEGEIKVHLETEAPDGKRTKMPEIPLELRKDKMGRNVIIGMELSFRMPGLYWFDVYVDEQVVTRMPLKVTYSAVATG